jgi:hypothetical protein
VVVKMAVDCFEPVLVSATLIQFICMNCSLVANVFIDKVNAFD